jgi:response regulator RpfG family c-di-GMP phosphodiesterase
VARNLISVVDDESLCRSTTRLIESFGLRAALTEGCGIPIIFITAYDGKESRRRAMQAGAGAFLGKPISDERLLQPFVQPYRRGTETND